MRLLPTGRSRRLLLVLVAALAVGGGVVTTTGTADAFLHRLFKPLVQTISLSIKRGQTYERLENQRDEQIADVDERAAALEWQIANGWLADADAIARERARHEEWAQAISDRTEREKQITRASYNRAIGVAWQEAAIEAITQIPGVNPRAGRALQSILRGESPLEAALAAVTDGTPEPDEIDVLRAEWGEARDALRNVRLPQVQGLRAKLDLLLNASHDPLGTIADRTGLATAASEVRDALGQLRNVANEWTVRGARIQPSRFQRDERWQQLSAYVQALGQNTAGQALIAGMARQTIERVRALAEANGLTLDAEQLMIIAAAASRGGIGALIDARANGGTFEIDFETITRDAINQWLAAAGLRPLPDPLSGNLTLPTLSRVGERVSFMVEPTGGGTLQAEPDYQVEWFVDPVPVAVGRTNALDRTFDSQGDKQIRVVVTDRASGQQAEAIATITVLGPFAVSIGPLGLFGQAGDVFNPDPETALSTVYVGEIVRYTAFVDNATPGVAPIVEWTFPGAAVAPDDVRVGGIPPALRAPGRPGWYVDRSIDIEGTHLVRVTVTDPQTDDTASALLRVTVVQEFEDPNNWHAATSCRVEGEGEGYDYEWRVKIIPPQNDNDPYRAEVFFHDCPGRGRALYTGEALPQGGGRWLVSEAKLAAGQGALGLLAGGERPGPLSMLLIAGTAPQPNIRAELGTGG